MNRIVIGVLFLVFSFLLGALALGKPLALQIAAIATIVIYVVFTLSKGAAHSRKSNLGILIPGTLYATLGALEVVSDPWIVAAGIWALGLSGALAVSVFSSFGRKFHNVWSCASAPITWAMGISPRRKRP